MSESLKAGVAIDALEMAIAARNPAPGLIHHSDRGIQYACGDYQKVIVRAGKATAGTTRLPRASFNSEKRDDLSRKV